jgi:tetratricopeptide (TPR) repeat protein
MVRISVLPFLGNNSTQSAGCLNYLAPLCLLNSTSFAASVPIWVDDAEAAIAKSDWKTAENRWTCGCRSIRPTPAPCSTPATWPTPKTATRTRRGLYRRAIAADPKSFEAHLSLGLLLARQGKTEDARPELLAATALDPGDTGVAMKARAWRALARIDQAGDRPLPPTICWRR